MPSLFDEIISIPAQPPISVKLEPAFLAFQALLLIYKSQQENDMDEWIIQTALSMTPEERHRNTLVTIGFHFAAVPDRSWPSFPAYLQYLEGMDAVALRNRMLDAYQVHSKKAGDEFLRQESIYDALETEETYLDFLRKRFYEVDPEIELEAYHYVIQPEAMKDVIVDHLTHMWEKYLQSEWQKVRPTLKAVVDAFEGVDFSGMSPLAAAKFITGQDISSEKLAKHINEAKLIIFVPSAVAGRYFGHYLSNNTLRILYKARLPKIVDSGDAALSRAEILIRLNTISDDTRLRILQYIAEHGETRSQTLIDELDLSQSAASRHLSALSGMGYLMERRCEGAKCYAINAERIEETLRALAIFLLGKEGNRSLAGQKERSIK